MNVLIHMGDSYPDEGPNAKRMRTFYEALTEKGHKVSVIAPTYGETFEEIPDVIYCKVPPLKSKSSWNRLMNQLGIGFTSIKAAEKVGRIDVVITTAPPALISPFGWLIAKRKHAKLVYDVRDIWPDVAWELGSFKPKSMYSRVFELVRNFMLKNSDLVTTVTKGKVEKLRGYTLKEKVVYIPNGLDERFLDNEIREDLVKKYRLKEKFSCVYFGNIGLAQGLKQLLYVAEKAKIEGLNVQFLLFGSGVEEKILKEYVAEKKLDNVFFPGKIPNRDMLTILTNASMSFISLKNSNLKDSVPTKMFEALGAGCPVLLAAAGDAAEILEESRLGYAVEPNNEKALWSAFNKMFFNLDEVLKNKDNARKLMDTEYSRQKAALKLEQVLVDHFEKRKKEQ